MMAGVVMWCCFLEEKQRCPLRSSVAESAPKQIHLHWQFCQQQICSAWHPHCLKPGRHTQGKVFPSEGSFCSSSHHLALCYSSCISQILASLQTHHGDAISCAGCLSDLGKGGRENTFSTDGRRGTSAHTLCRHACVAFLVLRASQNPTTQRLCSHIPHPTFPWQGEALTGDLGIKLAVIFGKCHGVDLICPLHWGGHC